MPGTFLLVGLRYLVFSVGYTAMNRFVGNAGGFYPYVAHGLARPAGVAGAFIALVTHNAIDVAVYGLFGFFANDIVKTAGGLDLHWLVYSTVLAAAVFRCGVRNIEFSGTG